MKISKQWKKHLEISSFYTSVTKIMIICYTVPEIYGPWWMQLLFFILGYFLLFYPLNSPKNVRFLTKKHLEISFYTCVPKLWLDDVQFLRYVVQRTDGQKKWYLEVGAPPKQINISNRVQLSLGWKTKNCKPNSLIQTLLYRSNIYNFKIYQREHWKKQ